MIKGNKIYIAHPTSTRRGGGYSYVVELFESMEAFRKYYPRSKAFSEVTLDKIIKSGDIVRFM